MQSSGTGGDLRALAWPEVPPRPLVLVPIGSTEQHGPHLPFDTDSRIAAAVAASVAERLRASGDPVVVTPVLTFGASGEHQHFAGTVSIGHDALHLVIVELVRSLATWAGHIVLVNGHGGNVPTLAAAVPALRAEHHPVTWVPCALPAPIPAPAATPPATASIPAVPPLAASAASTLAPVVARTWAEPDAHAGRTETSLMLHLDPDSVRLPLPAAGATEPLRDLLPRMTVAGVAAVSPSGILGDPTGATAAEGADLLAAITTEVTARLATAPDPRGMHPATHEPTRATPTTPAAGAPTSSTPTTSTPTFNESRTSARLEGGMGTEVRDSAPEAGEGADE